MDTEQQAVLKAIQDKLSTPCSPSDIQQLKDRFNDIDVLRNVRCLIPTLKGNPNSDIISVRVPETILQHYKLLNEAYVGIVFLNDLRSITSSFKYIFDYRDGMTYEETMIDFPELTTLPDKELRSVILQLLSSLEYAHQKGVSNFPLEIRLRPVDINLNVPVLLNGKVVQVPTFGRIPVFSRFYSASAPGPNDKLNPYTGLPKTLEQEREDLLKHFGITNLDFNDIIIESSIVRTKTFVKSLIRRVDELIMICQAGSSNNPAIYLTWPVLQKYIQILQALEMESGDAFEPERPNTGNIKRSDLRLHNGMIRSDHDFIDLASQLVPNSGNINVESARSKLDAAINVGHQLRTRNTNLHQIYTHRSLVFEI